LPGKEVFEREGEGRFSSQEGTDSLTLENLKGKVEGKSKRYLFPEAG